MKKLLLVLTVIILFGCCKDEDFTLPKEEQNTLNAELVGLWRQKSTLTDFRRYYEFTDDFKFSQYTLEESTGETEYVYTEEPYTIQRAKLGAPDIVTGFDDRRYGYKIAFTEKSNEFPRYEFKDGTLRIFTSLVDKTICERVE